VPNGNRNRQVATTFDEDTNRELLLSTILDLSIMLRTAPQDGYRAQSDAEAPIFELFHTRNKARWTVCQTARKSGSGKETFAKFSLKQKIA